MRRTQQNADQQRRRGVRSRLVACVAAVAMLVTSVAAGTAVAAELGGGDAADQTTQNTATLEQQGTGDTGDNNQTTTNGDGQADGDQPSDADSGSEGDEVTADNGAADGTGTTESDVQSQGDAAAKSANAVPAPQSVDADANADAGVSAQAEDTGTNLLTETFTGSTPSNQDAWKFFGAAGLTKAGDGRTQNQSGTENVDRYGNKDYRVSGTSGSSDYFDTRTDDKGPGYLQLTDNQGGQTGTVLYNEPVQSSLGLDVQFYMWQFNSAGTNPPADGTGFFLVDGSTDLSKQGPQGGNYGGALGYSAMEGGNKGEDGETVPGLADGVLGVGFDMYGNYSSKRDVGGSNVRTNNGADVNQTYSVTVRGAGTQDWNGDWTKGYDILAQKQLNRDERSYLQTSAPSQTGNRRDKENVDNQANGTLVSIHITPSSQDLNGDQYITITLTDEDGHSTTPINGVKLQEKLPALVKFGFSASTGSNKDVHFIRGLEVSTVLPAESNIFMTKTINHDETQDGVPTSKTTFAEGETVPYTFAVQNVGSKTLTNVHIEDPLVANIHLEDSEATSTTLKPGEQAMFYGSLVLTKDQARQGSLTNTAVAKGNDGEKNITDDGSVTITTVVPVEPLGMPDHTKKIGDNGNGTYTLALDVTGKTQTSGGTTTTPVDVVMIIDNSTSMDEDITTSSKVTYNKVNKVVESDGQTYTDYYWDWNYPFRHEYQRAKQTSRPTDTYYVYLNDQYVEVDEQTKTVNGERGTSYQDHVSWTANGTEVDPSNTPFYTRHTSSSSMSKMDAVKEAAKGFVNSAAGSAGASAIRVGVVKFGSSSYDVIGLTSVAGTGAETVNKAIDDIDVPYANGTQPAQSFTNAKNMLAKSPSGTQKVVIFFTDGEPGDYGFTADVANDTIKTAKTLKDAGVTVWSVGVFDGADPKESIKDTFSGSDTDKKMNAYMHATSSNYPRATGFTDNPRGMGSNAGYYQAASTSEQLNEIFQDIFHDSTKTQAYGNVSIVDELSQWAQVADSVKWDDSEGVHTDYGYPVTEGVTLEVKDANGNPVNKGDANYPYDVMFYYEPASDETTDATGTVRAVFGDTYQLQDKWTYTLKFDVKPTDAAYQEYATNGYGNTTGAEGTDLYTNEGNTPVGGNMNTSANKPGFRSNNRAYVQYTADGDQQTTDYAHPVLQLKAATLEGNAFVTVSKTVEGRRWLGDESFTFDLEAQDNAPLPVDAEGQEQSSISIDKPADGSATNTGTFGTITYTKSGVYEYTLTERVPEADEQHGLNYSDAEYTITVVVSDEMKTKVIVTDSDGKTVQSGVASFVNSLAPYEYAVGDHLNLRKELVNGTLTEGEFSFRLTDVTSYKEGASHLTIKDCKDPASGCTVTNKVPDGSDQSVAELNDFDAVMFTEPGTYYVKVVEDTDARPDSGYYVFDDRALYVKYDVQVNAQTGVLEMTRSVYREPENTDTQLDGIDENDWLSSNIDASTLTWTNTYVAPVSALPLTGGDMTARVLVLVGSGMLLVAGLAWLLAQRRRV